MELIPVGPENRERINAFITERWYTLEMVVRGEVVDMAKAEGSPPWRRAASSA